MNEPNQTLVDFESFCGIGSTYAADLLGMGQSTYAQVRSQVRKLKLYQKRHIEALMLLPKPVLDELIERHTRMGL